jgi:hypothetical protein
MYVSDDDSWALEEFANVKFDGTVRDLLVRSFDAYVRIFNPAVEPTVAAASNRVSWARANATSRPLTAGTQWNELQADSHLDAPAMGDIHPVVANELANILAAETRTPEQCAFALWTGYAEIAIPQPSVRITLNPQRDLILFTGHVATGADPSRRRRPVNWRPADRAWALGNDIYSRSVFVGGTSTTIGRLRASPYLEALVVDPNMVLLPEDR